MITIQGRVLAVILIFVFSGCSTLTKKKEETLRERLPGNKKVSFQVNELMQEYFPKCIAVLPFDDSDSLDVEQDFQKAFHAQLSTTGIRLIPLQAKVSESDLNSRFSDCDMKLTGKVLENKRKHYAVYSEYRAGVETKLTHIESNTMFWRANHTLIKRGGTLPIGVVSTITGIFSASKNVEEAQTGRITYEIANQMVQTIPNLHFQELKRNTFGVDAHDNTRKKTCPGAMHEFIAKTEELKDKDKIDRLGKALKDKEFCSDSSSQLVLAQRIQQIDSKNRIANDWLIDHYYKRESFVDVIKVADQLISQGHDLEKYRMQRGDSLRRINEYEKAIEDFLSVLGSDPSNGQAYFFLARSYAALGRFDIASAGFEKSLSVAPENTDTMLFAGIAHAADNKEDKAFAMLRRALVLEMAGKNIQKSRIIVNTMRSTGTFNRLSKKEKTFIEREIDNF